MKKIMLSALIAVMVAGGALAQEPQPPHKAPRRAMGFMQDLNLTDAQKAEMKTINEDFRKQMGELRKNEDITVKEWKSKMQAIQKDHRDKVQGLLTDEQKAKIEKMRKDHKPGDFKGRRGSQHKGRGPQRMNAEKMKKELGLTDEQSAKLKQNRTDMMTKLKALREDKSLSQEQKKAEMKKFREQQQESLKSILTPEQLQKLQQHKPHRSKPVQS